MSIGELAPQPVCVGKGEMLSPTLTPCYPCHVGELAWGHDGGRADPAPHPLLLLRRAGAPVPWLGSTVELTPVAGTGEDEPAPRAGEQSWLTLPLAGHTSDVGAEELSG